VGEFPLILTIVHDMKVAGEPVRVITKARALMEQIEGEWWCHGVEPGGMTAQVGPDPAPAFASFKKELGKVLEDLAEDCDSTKDFQAVAEAFVLRTDIVELAKWEKARAIIREGSKVAQPFDALDRIKTDFKASLSVFPMKKIEVETGEVVELAQAA